MKRLLFIAGACVLWLCQVNAQMVGEARSGTFALLGGTVIVSAGDTVRGDLVISDGKIAAVGQGVSVPQDAIRIDCEGLFVFPGMMDCGTAIGLAEVGSISLTQDSDEIGDFTPHMLSLTAVNPNSVLIPVARVNGITSALTVPSRGMFPGTASLVHLFGYTPAQMDAGFHGVVLNFPATGRRGRFDRRSDEQRERDEKKNLEKLNEIWNRAKQYASIDSAGAKDKLDYLPEWEAMLPVVRGESPILIEVDREKDILLAIKWVKEKGVRAIFTGVVEGWRVADSIAAAGIPVITGPVLSTPSRSSDRYDTPYRNAGIMLAAGVKVAIRTNEKENVRNLPYNAAFAAAYGMGKEEAFRAVTEVPAEIFGLGDHLGTLETGKMANLFVADGDPFETQTQVRHLFIQGYQVPVESRHTLLYDEFLDRNPGTDLRGDD